MYGKKYENITEFNTICQKFLQEHEAENNLIFGILETLKTNIHAYDPIALPEFIIIFDQEKIALVSIRTPPHNQIISYTDNTKTIPVLVEFLTKKETQIPGVLGPKKEALLFAEQWTKIHNKTMILNMNERIYKLEQVNPVTIGKNHFKVASEEDLSLLADYAQKFAEDAFANTTPDQIERNRTLIAQRMEQWIREKSMYILKANNEIVSIARASRDTPNGRSITLVYTPPQYRRHGYATELVAKLCQMILKEGKKYCFLFTDLANPTSNKIYMQVGFKPIMDVDEYRFE